MDRLRKQAREETDLNRLAVRSSTSRGRAHAEGEDRFRTAFERDRDRVIHCSGFRRLMYKTQVFVNHVGDNLRTRLTHSLEVLQVSRSLAGALDLNEALCEAVALAHDLGHAPYGHSGEELLDAKMKSFGGFDHNLQSQRVVTVLERRSPEYRGLNLTAETLECMRKHEEAVDPDSGARLRWPLLEAQLVDLADSTAYHYHDVDDGLRQGILNPENMEAELELWFDAVVATRRQHPGLEGRLLWRRAANELLGIAISDVATESEQRIAASPAGSARAAQSGEQRLIAHSEACRSKVAALHKYLYEHMYYREEVNWHVRRATELLGKVFDALVARKEKIPAHFFETADSTERAACDYLQGMTDRYVETVARELGVLPAY
ncbi:MAG: dNTP triphosphohydrolase [Planctomycetota bacterium]|nr:dNTP triphosphohydrolase [Planctomycetota bacterium]